MVTGRRARLAAMGSRRLVFAALLLAAAVVGIAAMLRSRAPSAAPIAPAPATATRPRLRVDRPMVALPSTPGRRPKSELPPPPGYVPPAAGPTTAAAPAVALPAGELPMVPPAFAHPEERQAFRGWWTHELGRRVAIFERLEQDHPYPNAAEAAQLIDAYYDAAEARRPDETAEQASRRADLMLERFHDFVAAFGVPPQTIATRAGDPQYGASLPPPGGIAAPAGRPVAEWPDRVPVSAMPQPR